MGAAPFLPDELYFVLTGLGVPVDEARRCVYRAVRGLEPAPGGTLVTVVGQSCTITAAADCASRDGVWLLPIAANRRAALKTQQQKRRRRKGRS